MKNTETTQDIMAQAPNKAAAGWGETHVYAEDFSIFYGNNEAIKKVNIKIQIALSILLYSIQLEILFLTHLAEVQRSSVKCPIQSSNGGWEIVLPDSPQAD